MKPVLIFFASIFLAFQALAQIISPSSVEVKFSYKAQFRTQDNKTDVYEKANDHAQHLFGVFHSPKLTRSVGLNYKYVGGVGAMRLPLNLKATESRDSQGFRVIKYSVAGHMILHKKTAAQWLKQGGITLPLPYEIDDFYDKKCTDAYYDTMDDFWYFYDPYRRGCERFARAPMAAPVAIKMQENLVKKVETSPRLDLLRANNGNGELFEISIFHGFAESSKNKNDDGRWVFGLMNQFLKQRGFSEKVERKVAASPLHVFTQRFQVGHRTIEVRIKNLLVDTAITARTMTFAKYFKEAVENSDVVLYSGHSGLGGNLDIPSIEEKVGRFRFNHQKRQLFFFDSCASYSYYLTQFAETKTKAKIDILSNGLSSYFHTGPKQHEEFIDILLEFDENPSWAEMLNRLEKALDGNSYLLNAGAI